MPRNRVPLVFGRGLDRETGIMATQPSSMDDLRNIYHRRGKVVLRKGNVPKLEFADVNGEPHSVILAGHMLLGERTGVVVAYQGDAAKAAHGDVDIYLLDAAATVQRRLGNWFNAVDLGLDLTNPPIVSVTDHFNRAFFAHNEFRITRRAPTFVYDPFEGDELQPLLIGEDWSDADTIGVDDKIRFRGVESYLDYLVGWGYGTPSEHRAELVRLSIPGDPKTFREEHYVLAGARKDPTIACRPAGNELAIFKEVETWRLVGHDRYSFGVKPLDERFGCVASRLSVSVEGTCFFWSTHGPRYTEGGPSVNIANALELDASEPSTLVDANDLVCGWANYIAEQRVVVFAFNRRLYVLSLHDVRNPRWSYWELGFDQFCGFQLYVTGVGVSANTQPTAHAEWDREFADNQFEDNNPPSAGMLVEWDNVGQDGDETVEVWGQVGNNLVGDFWRMRDDADGDGTVDGFTADTSATTATFELSGVLPRGQIIDVTASSGAGHALVEREVEGIVAGNVYTISVELHQLSVAGGAHPELELEWRDGGGTPISTETVDLTPVPTAEPERRFLYDRTAPGGAESVVVRCKVATTAGGDLARIMFRLIDVLDQAELEGWSRITAFPVSAGVQQRETLRDLEPGHYYQIALRYRRSVFFAAGYTSSDPDDWPDESKGVGVAAPQTEPQITLARWKPRTGGSGQVEEYFDVTVETGDRFDLDLALFVDDDDDIEFSNPIATISPPHLATEILQGLLRDSLLGTLVRRTYTLEVSYITGSGARVGAGDSISGVWPGPINPPANVFAENHTPGGYQVSWEWDLLPDYLFGTPAVRVEENIDGGGWNTADGGAGFITDQTQTEYERTGIAGGSSVQVRVSHEVSFSFQQFRSEYAPPLGIPAFTV